jgi:hypothetical protein
VTIPSSTTTAVRQYLFDQLTAALTPDPLYKDSGLIVCFDTPGPDQEDDIVSVGKVEREIKATAVVGGGGAGWLEERYSVTITFDVYRGGDDAQAVYSRAQFLADAVIAIVRTDPSLGGLVLISHPSRHSSEVDWDENHLGRHCTAELDIECFQRI